MSGLVSLTFQFRDPVSQPPYFLLLFFQQVQQESQTRFTQRGDLFAFSPCHAGVSAVPGAGAPSGAFRDTITSFPAINIYLYSV
jgi:hypothetical protein